MNSYSTSPILARNLEAGEVDVSDQPKRFRILSEEVVHRSGQPDIENPYWLDEGPEPHPNPEQGCIRRGICCRTSPGWFAPGEVEKAASLKGMQPDSFVRQYLIIDAIHVDDELVHVFAPVKLDRLGNPAFQTAAPVDDLYRTLRGTCIFFTGQGCGIYDARPTECEAYVCTNAPDDQPDHVDIARLWKEG